jgi:hypothetical protein
MNWIKGAAGLEGQEARRQGRVTRRLFKAVRDSQCVFADSERERGFNPEIIKSLPALPTADRSDPRGLREADKRLADSRRREARAYASGRCDTRPKVSPRKAFPPRLDFHFRDRAPVSPLPRLSRLPPRARPRWKRRWWRRRWRPLRFSAHRPRWWWWCWCRWRRRWETLSRLLGLSLYSRGNRSLALRKLVAREESPRSAAGRGGRDRLFPFSRGRRRSSLPYPTLPPFPLPPRESPRSLDGTRLFCAGAT